MNYRIYICSSSGINNISHPPTIKSIPLILEPSLIEQYYENSDLNNEMFITRARLDNRYKKNVKKRSIKEIKEIIKKDIENKMTVYILLSKYYSDEDSDLLSNDNVFAFNYDLYGNALISMALSLDNAISNNYEKIYDNMNIIKNSYYSIYFSPKNDIECQRHYKNIEDEINILFDKADAFQIIDGEFNSIIANNDYLLNEIDIIGIDNIYIEYTNQYSNYLNYLENLILAKNPKAVIKKIQISPSFFNIIGENAIGVGYIKNE